jgi:enoyl-CoA hydratase/carnithine racemase
MGALEEAIAYLGALDDLRCVVLSGEGRSFCSGMDVSVLSGAGIGPLSPRTHGMANRAQHCSLGWRTLPVPVIAAVRGHCFGGGLQLAMGADIRIARPDARFSVMELRHGLVPDMGLFALVRGIVREDVLRDLIFTAREFSGEQALQLGFATRTDAEPLEAAMALAHDIAGKSPLAIRAAKRLVERMAENDMAALLLAESQEQDAIIATLSGQG